MTEIILIIDILDFVAKKLFAQKNAQSSLSPIFKMYNETSFEKKEAFLKDRENRFNMDFGLLKTPRILCITRQQYEILLRE